MSLEVTSNAPNPNRAPFSEISNQLNGSTTTIKWGQSLHSPFSAKRRRMSLCASAILHPSTTARIQLNAQKRQHIAGRMVDLNIPLTMQTLENILQVVNREIGQTSQFNFINPQRRNYAEYSNLPKTHVFLKPTGETNVYVKLKDMFETAEGGSKKFEKALSMVFSAEPLPKVELVARLTAFPEAADEVLAEAKLLQQLTSEFICGVQDFAAYKNDEKCVIYAPLGDFGDLLDYFTAHIQQFTIQERFPLVLQMFRQMSQAVKFTHDLDIVHADIKLENFFVAQQGDTFKVMLGDFGAAYGHPERLTLDEHFLGTPSYYSPEFLSYILDNILFDNVDPQNIGKPSDMWALGCCFYTLYHDGKMPRWTSLIDSIGDLLGLYNRKTKCENDENHFDAPDTKPKPPLLMTGKEKKSYIEQSKALEARIMQQSATHLVHFHFQKDVPNLAKQDAELDELQTAISDFVEKLQDFDVLDSEVIRAIKDLVNVARIKMEQAWEALDLVPAPEQSIDKLLWRMLKHNSAQRIEAKPLVDLLTRGD